MKARQKGKQSKKFHYRTKIDKILKNLGCSLFHTPLPERMKTFSSVEEFLEEFK